MTLFPQAARGSVRFLAAALCLALAACGPRTSDRPVADPTDPHPLPIPYTGGPLAISQDAVGPLRWDAPRTAEVLRALFPDAKIDRQVRTDGDTQAPVLIVERNNQPILEAVGPPDDPLLANRGSPFEIRIYGGEPVGPNGERLMDRWSRLGLKAADCTMGEGRDRFALVCPAPKTEGVALIFGIPGWTSDQTPPDAVLADKAFLREFLWTYSQHPISPPAVS